MQLVYGIIKAIRTWDMPEDVSEAKYFAVAIYNISVIGSFCYFLSVFGNATVETVVILRCVGIFFSATIASLVIMAPKFVAIQLNWTEFLLGVKSSFEEDYSSAPDGSNPLDTNPNHMYGESVEGRSGRGGLPQQLLERAMINTPGLGTVGGGGGCGGVGGGGGIPSTRERVIAPAPAPGGGGRIAHGPINDKPVLIPLGQWSWSVMCEQPLSRNSPTVSHALLQPYSMNMP